jgi:hypothetical protein
MDTLNAHVPTTLTEEAMQHLKQPAAPRSVHGSGAVRAIQLFVPLPVLSAHASTAESNKVSDVNNVQVMYRSFICIYLSLNLCC